MSFRLSPIAPLEAARQFIDKISKPALILVAVSGGSDSTGLLIALHCVLKDAGREDVRLHAVTIDHALRSESAEEARDVATLCSRLDIPHHIRRWNDTKPTSGISAAARLARYTLIGAVADEIDADVVVVGHTLGDQQETVAMRSARSQRDDNLGLAGMADAVLYNCRHWVMRPFLNSLRDDIRDFLRQEGQGWIDDPSNVDDKYERVRTRNRLQTGILIDQSINRSELSSFAAEWIGKHTQYYGFGLIEIDARGLIERSIKIRYGLSSLASVIGGRRFAMAAGSMDKVMEFVLSAQPGRITAGRVVFERRRNALYLMRENRNLPAIKVAAGERVRWDERFDISNSSDADIIVRAVGGNVPEGLLCAFPATVPPVVARRALQTSPVFERDGQPFRVAKENIEVHPLLAPYDLFLTSFDLQLANVIAGLLGRKPYTALPV